MKIIISPAKKLNFASPLPEAAQKVSAEIAKKNNSADYFFEKQTQQIVKLLKKLSPKDFSRQFSLSDSLAQLNYDRFKSFTSPTNKNEAEVREALFAFNGDVYAGLNANTLSKEELKYIANNLFILSGLYGLLRPFTKIRPYRLEMGKKLPNGQSLYNFWGDAIAKALLRQLKKDEILMNLASEEYFSSIAPYLAGQKIISIIFKGLPAKVLSKQNSFASTNNAANEDDYKIISFHAKKARGLFARFLAMNAAEIKNCQKPLQLMKLLQNFDADGYFFYKKEIKNGQPALTFLRN